MTEQKPELSAFQLLEQKVLSGQSSAEETREYMIKRDLDGLASTLTYLKESKHTKEWACPHCGGPIPCSIDCPQCGEARPEANFDIEQEGEQGFHRKVAGFRDIGDEEELVSLDELETDED